MAERTYRMSLDGLNAERARFVQAKPPGVESSVAKEEREDNSFTMRRRDWEAMSRPGELRIEISPWADLPF